jgi:hypothetical protein
MGFTVDVTCFVADEIGQRRFKWRLIAPDEVEVPSSKALLRNARLPPKGR